MDIKFRQLRALDAITRLGSFAEASRALHVTPAALSVTIREMEQTVGFRVLERTTRRVRLTEPGQRYYLHVQRVLAELQEAERCAMDVRHGLSGVVRIAAAQTVISVLLPVAFRLLRQKLPDVRIHPVDVPLNGIVEAIHTGQADVAIGVRFPVDEKFECHTLLKTRWHCFMEKSHPLAGRKSVNWRDVVEGPLILIGASTRLHLQSALGEALQPQDVYDVGTANAALAMASSGQGVAVAPGYLRPRAPSQGLKALPLREPEIDHVLEVCIARQLPADAAARQVRDLLLHAIPEAHSGLW